MTALSGDYSLSMTTETLTKTVIFPLETSARKTERLRACIAEWQEMASTVANHHASFPDYEWGRTKQNPSWYRILRREHDDADIHSQGKLAALHKVGSAFKSWRENAKPGQPPQFGEGDYCRFTADGVEVVKNDTGYGLKVKLEPYNAEWWHINASDYHRDYCQGIVDCDLQLGSVELHCNPETGAVKAHAAISSEVDVLPWSDVETAVGVDLGETALYTAVAKTSGGVASVNIESGGEYRHYRERLKAERRKLQADGKRREAHSARTRYEDYTDHVMHAASREIVDFAADHDRAGVVLEDLTDYRETADDPIHDWPYQQLQTKICYKATEKGIPVKIVDAAYTSRKCRMCGDVSPRNRDGDRFKCSACGYEVHADMNAASNIATMARVE